jgi:hypothetical protein
MTAAMSTMIPMELIGSVTIWASLCGKFCQNKPQLNTNPAPGKNRLIGTLRTSTIRASGRRRAVAAGAIL